MKYQIALFVFLSLSSLSATAQTAYVTDELRLGLHRAEDTTDRAFKVLVSGQELEILERNSLYARVRTTDGVEGWVKANYLVSDKPAKLRVSEMEATVKESSDRLRVAEKELSESNKKVRQLESAISTTQSSASETVENAEKFQEENEELRSQLKLYRQSVPLSWALGAGLVFLTIGFVGGLWWLDYRIRKRHGGFRIY